MPHDSIDYAKYFSFVQLATPFSFSGIIVTNHKEHHVIFARIHSTLRQGSPPSH